MPCPIPNCFIFLIVSSVSVQPMLSSEVSNLLNPQHPQVSSSDRHCLPHPPSPSSARSGSGLSGLWFVSGCLSMGCVATALPTIHPFLTRAIGTTWQVNFVFVLAALISTLLLATPHFTHTTGHTSRRSNSSNWLLRSSMAVFILTIGIIVSILATPSIPG